MDYMEPEEHDGAWWIDEGSMLAEQTSSRLPRRVQKGAGATSRFKQANYIGSLHLRICLS